MKRGAALSWPETRACIAMQARVSAGLVVGMAPAKTVAPGRLRLQGKQR
nr:hypothetical protein [Marinicella sp. W31]MDC2879451.1 hypothetical protein [Marinicella sp. W31]